MGPHILDDETVERTCRAFGEAQADVDLCDRQPRRWGAQKLTTRQAAGVARPASGGTSRLPMVALFSVHDRYPQYWLFPCEHAACHAH